MASEAHLTGSRASYWDGVYEARGEAGVSWFQPRPRVSVELVDALGPAAREPAIDVGGGASRLVDDLLGRGWRDVTVLDVSAAALEMARARVGPEAPVTWLHQDVLTWQPPRRFGLWHDRAVFHFLVDPDEQRTYLETVAAAIEPGGAVILATFAPDGPEQCSGLPVHRYSSAELAGHLGPAFRLVAERREEHLTPAGAVQAFTWIGAVRAPA